MIAPANVSALTDLGVLRARHQAIHTRTNRQFLDFMQFWGNFGIIIYLIRSTFGSNFMDKN